MIASSSKLSISSSKGSGSQVLMLSSYASLVTIGVPNVSTTGGAPGLSGFRGLGPFFFWGAFSDIDYVCD
jgi:hypothetical protein